ncbi:hypothetical protein TcCL_Unassigned02750 [Trypanosoma cruzi]|nr:hypothetical protein TcCL_Unassigned02750 [Trypanosoma cruzi]
MQLVRLGGTWAVAHADLLFWMSLFHAPLLAHRNCRTDRHTQPTKVLQTRFCSALLVSHAGPSLLLPRRPSVAALEVNDEATVTTVFLREFCATTVIILCI